MTATGGGEKDPMDDNNMATTGGGEKDQDVNVDDIVSHMIPPDVFLHRIVGPYLTPKENKWVVQRVWNTGFDWKTHCCSKHSGTVFTYFEDPPRYPPPAPANDDDGEEEEEEGEDENQDQEGAAVAPSVAAPAAKEDTTTKEDSDETKAALVLRCLDCVMEDFRGERRCDHCNVFQRAGRVSNKCRRCPQIFCDSCERASFDGVCGECTLCACCRDVIDFPEEGEGCKTCSGIYCGGCRTVLQTSHDELKENYRIATLAAIEEAKKQKLAAAAEAREQKLQADRNGAADVTAALAFEDSSVMAAAYGDPSATTESSTSQEKNLAAVGTDANVNDGGDINQGGGGDPSTMETSTTQAEDMTAVGAGASTNANTNQPAEAVLSGSQCDNNGGDDAPEDAGEENGGEGNNVTGIAATLWSNLCSFLLRACLGTDNGGDAPPNAETQQEGIIGVETNPEDGGNDADEQQEVNYDALNLPNLNKELTRVQVCRRCNYCYCSTCGFQHQCNCCGCSYWM